MYGIMIRYRNTNHITLYPEVLDTEKDAENKIKSLQNFLFGVDFMPVYITSIDERTITE